MTDKEKKVLNPKVQWAKFVVVTVLYLLFLYWVKSWWGLLVLPFIFDVYITKRIKWQWWREGGRASRRHRLRCLLHSTRCPCLSVVRI